MDVNKNQNCIYLNTDFDLSSNFVPFIEKLEAKISIFFFWQTFC